MKKRILTMLLAAVMMMALVPAVFAADGGWAPLSITAGYVDVTFSAAKIVKTPVKHWVDSNGSSFFVESDEEGQPLTTGMTQQDWPVTCVLLQPGSDVTVTYNEDFVEIVDTNDEAGASLYYMGYLEPGELLADVDFSKLVGKEAPLWSSTCMEKDGAYITVETWWIRSGKVENGFSPVDAGIGRIIETDGGDYLVQISDAPAEPTITFPDVAADAWFADSVKYVVAEGLMKGSDGKFSPQKTITRAEVAQILYNRADTPGAGSAVFSDVAGNDWFYAAVTWAADNGLVQGSGGAFSPRDTITREQLAVMLYNAADRPAADPTALNARPDGGRVSGWARTQMAWAVESGIITGDGNGNLNPQDTASRAEVAAMVQRFCEKFGS